MTGSTYISDLKPDDGVLQVIKHEYKNVEKQVMQTVKIAGTFDGIDNKLACDNLSIGNCFIQESTVIGSSSNGGIPGTSYTINKIGKLVQVLSWGDFDYKTLNNMFYKAEGLWNIPNESLPNVNYAMYTFAGCSKLTKLPSKFKLPYALLNAEGMFASAGLAGVAVQNLEINENLCVINNMFKDCKDLTEKPEKFYTNKYINVDFINKKDNSNAFVGTAVENPTDIS